MSRYARKKKRSFQIIKTRSQKFSQRGQLKTRRSRSPKTGIFHRGQSMVLAKKLEFFQVFILGKIGQEDVYYDIVERKNASTDFIKKSSRSRKIGIFPKGLVHCFGQKLAIFPRFFFRQNGPRKFVLRYFRKKNGFLD